MKMLYHPKRILGFEPYVAPEGFDRKAQPVDIYDVFERYYRHHRDARWILSISDSFTTNPNLTPGEIPFPLNDTNYLNPRYVYGYILGGIKYRFNVSVTSYVGTIPDGYYTSVEVLSTEGFPDSGKICVGTYDTTTNLPYFQYDSKDSTHFYWSGSAQRLFPVSSAYKKVTFVPNFTGTTGRYMIMCNSETGMSSAHCGTGSYSLKTYGYEWLYAGNKINSISTSTANAGASTVKYIHCHRLDNITVYPYGAHRGTPLTGILYVTKSATQFSNLCFNGCLITEVDIPSNITVIQYECFWACTSLIKLTLHEGLLELGTRPFNGCSGIASPLIIPNSCTIIGLSAFQGCSKIPSLDLGTGVQTIANSAFQGCALMAGTLTLPDSLTAIGTLAFYGCTSFSGTLTIPANITSIGQGAFGDDNFSDIDVTANSRYEDVDDVLYEISTRTALHSVKSDTGTITFQTNTLIIGDYCCLRNQRTGTLTVPDSVTRVGIYAFYDCDGFTALDLETTTSALATIDDYAFSHCSSMGGTLTIPNSVTLIDAQAFQDDVLITSLSLGSGLVTIGANAFRQMTAISENLVIPNSVETIGATAFYNNTARTGTLTLGTGVKTIGTQAFGNTPMTGTLSIPSLVTAIGEGAFHNNNFSAISSAASGFTVSDYVLYDETASGQIKAHTSARGYSGTLTFKAGVTSILLYCFYNNDNRTGAIVIPYTVTAIGQQSFDDCSGFNSTATIGDATNGSGLTSIGLVAFRGCPNITEWNIYRTPAPTCNNSFSAYAKPLHVKSGATGYDITPATNAAPWTNTAIFSSVTADL